MRGSVTLSPGLAQIAGFHVLHPRWMAPGAISRRGHVSAQRHRPGAFEYHARPHYHAADRLTPTLHDAFTDSSLAFAAARCRRSCSLLGGARARCVHRIDIQQGNFLDNGGHRPRQRRHDARAGALAARHADGRGPVRELALGLRLLPQERPAARSPSSATSSCSSTKPTRSTQRSTDAGASRAQSRSLQLIRGLRAASRARAARAAAGSPWDRSAAAAGSRRDRPRAATCESATARPKIAHASGRVADLGKLLQQSGARDRFGDRGGLAATPAPTTACRSGSA